jgi:D-galactose 1-dehydrogenase
MGVFDPGINALSILTAILPAPVHLQSAASLEFPGQPRHADRRAAGLRGCGGSRVTADFDWRQEGPQTWEIAVETDRGLLLLQDGGARLRVDGAVVTEGPNCEYPALYAAMAELVTRGISEVDLAPMVHVADALTLGRRVGVAPFHF